MTKPNFDEMSVPQLRAYVLSHRDDLEAMRKLFFHPSLKYQKMPPLYENGKPNEENIRYAEETFQRLFGKNDSHSQED